MCTCRHIVLTGDLWKVHVDCWGANGNIERKIEFSLDQAQIDFFTLFTLKDQLGYCAQDFLYYKKRRGDDGEASAEKIGFNRDAAAMLQYLGSCQERKLRLIMSKQETVGPVNITPLKRSRFTEHVECAHDDDDADDFDSISQYKLWIQDQDKDCGESDDDCTTLSTLHYNIVLT